MVYEALLRSSNSQDVASRSARREDSIVLDDRLKDAINSFAPDESRTQAPEAARLQKAAPLEPTIARSVEYVDERRGADPTLKGRSNGHRPDHRLDLDELSRLEEIKLVQRLFLVPGSEARRAVLFAGVERDNGSAGICARAGESLATQAARSVCVVDANPHARTLHRYFGVENHKVPVGVTQSGPIPPTADPNGLLTPARLRPYMRELRQLFDHILISAPPMDLYAESLSLCQFVDGVVLVVEANATRRETVRKVKNGLESANVPLLGIVLNNRTFPIPESLYRKL